MIRGAAPQHESQQQLEKLFPGSLAALADGKAWLPVLHTQRPGWHFTALYSNIARAHDIGRVFDWVIIYSEEDQHREQPFTVVTATRGALHGRRVVRGREAECSQWVAASDATQAHASVPTT